MAKSNQPAYMQTTFDKAFVIAVEHLIKHKQQHRKFFSQKELIKSLGLIPQHYSEMKKAVRGVPKDKIAYVTKMLVNQYDVRDQFLKTGKGEITKQPLSDNLVNEPDVPYLVSRNDQCAEYRVQVQHLKELLEERNKYIKLQEEQIETLKRLSGLT